MSEQLKSKTTLGLELPTDPRWVNMAEKSLEEILSDHAYCEQKAATSCISLVSMYPELDPVSYTHLTLPTIYSV